MRKESPLQPEADQLPQHVAIIMDGNNRWAKANGLSGSAGHRAGAEAARKVVYSCIDRGIKHLTLFAFSSENWLRPNKEVRGLMALFLAVLKRKEIAQLHSDNVKLRFIGNRESFSPTLQHHMQDVEAMTADNTGTVVTVAADYGGQWDIANAAQRIAMQVEQGVLRADQVDVALVQRFISMAQDPPPDLCIRTGGESRISNFLLWQFAYTELYFTDCYWPVFDDAEFELAMQDYCRRQRRYGHLDNPDSSDELPVSGSV